MASVASFSNSALSASAIVRWQVVIPPRGAWRIPVRVSQATCGCEPKPVRLERRWRQDSDAECCEGATRGRQLERFDEPLPDDLQQRRDHIGPTKGSPAVSSAPPYRVVIQKIQDLFERLDVVRERIEHEEFN